MMAATPKSGSSFGREPAMKEKRKGPILQLINLISVVLMTIPFAWVWFRYYAGQMWLPFFNRGNWYMLLVFVIVYITFGRVYDGFSLSTNRISGTVFSQGLALLATDFVMYLILLLVVRRYLLNPVPLILALLAQCVLITVSTTLCHKFYFSFFRPYRTAVVYDDREGIEDLIRQYGLTKEFSVRKVVPIRDCLDDLGALDGMEVVFLSGVHSHERNIVLKYCMANDLTCYVLPRLGDAMLRGARRTHMFHLEVLELRPYEPPLYYVIVKRLADVVLSALALLVLSPLLLGIAAAIRLQDGGPVFYRQERLTKGGKRFMLVKFRSMRVDAESDGVARLSSGDSDPRITQVGRFLRRFRLDELPQLFSVLAGHMSLCGPRPERPEIAEQYEQILPEFNLRLQAKAGLTGYAQVYGKYNTSPYDKLLMDLVYIAHPSLLEDMRIIFATVKVLFIPESTEGVAAGQDTAVTSAEEKEG